MIFVELLLKNLLIVHDYLVVFLIIIMMKMFVVFFIVDLYDIFQEKIVYI
jgi:hypothetical protein